MTTKSTTIALALLSLMTAASCKKKDDAKPVEATPAATAPAATESAPVTSAKPTEPAADKPAVDKPGVDKPAGDMSEVRLEKLGLALDAPGGARVVVAGSVTKVLRDDFFVAISRASKGETFESAKQAAAANYPGAKNVTEEKLADGWLLSLDTVGNNDREEVVVTASRELGGTTFSCNVETVAAMKSAALAACKSLRK